MRKFYALLTAIALLALAAFPSFAQDEEQTIADIVVASATAEQPEFATLLTAVQAADPAVLEALSDPEAELTVFAPTDAAFAALQEVLGEEAFASVLADTSFLTEILLFHTLDGAVFSEDVVTALEETDGEFGVQTLQGQFIDIFQDEDGGIFIDGAGLMLEMVDIEASNGVIHVIDAVLLPEIRTIAEIVVQSAAAEEEAEFTSLLAAVQAADPTVLGTLSDPDVALTVFAPTDEAFAALGEETLNTVLGSQPSVTAILLYHVTDGATYSTDLLDFFMGDDMMEEGEMEDEAAEPAATEEAEMSDDMDGEMMDSLTITMLDGSETTITMTEEGVFINEAQIILTDIDAANGVIHVIDTVLLPPMDGMGE
ncbi:MAG: fasciclin domain-containing protein [Chloroflexota bacterium]